MASQPRAKDAAFLFLILTAWLFPTRISAGGMGYPTHRRPDTSHHDNEPMQTQQGLLSGWQTGNFPDLRQQQYGPPNQPARPPRVGKIGRSTTPISPYAKQKRNLSTSNVSDNVTLLKFSDAALEKIYRCLCDKETTLCQLQFTPDLDAKLSIVSQTDRKGDLILNGIKSIFECEWASEKFSVICKRPPKGSESIKIPLPDNRFRLETSHDTCGSKCSLIKRLDASLKRLNLIISPPISKGEVEPALQTQRSSNRGLVAAVVVGWLLFALSLTFIIAYIVYRKRKPKKIDQKIKQESSVSVQRIQVLGIPCLNYRNEEKRRRKQPTPIRNKKSIDSGKYAVSEDYTELYDVIGESNATAPTELYMFDDVSRRPGNTPEPKYSNPDAILANRASFISENDGYMVPDMQPSAPEQMQNECPNGGYLNLGISQSVEA